MVTKVVPTRDEIVARVAEQAPALRQHVAWSEEHRRLADEAVAALAEAGVFRLRTPERYGGYECDTRTLVDVATELGRVDGSLAWTASVYWIPTWMACLFPDAVQDQVFATPDVRVCGTLSPSGTATPTEGGIVVDGEWKFITGAWHAHWQQVIAIQFSPEGQPVPVLALVPMEQLRIVDDWYASGMSGSGSVKTVAEQVFVPAERVLPLPAVLEGQHAGEANTTSAAYRAPLLPVAAASSVGTAVGLARAARDAFYERMPTRGITYTSYEEQRTAPLTHLEAAEAEMAIDEAQFHAYRLADLVDAKGNDGSPWSVSERVQARADLGAACRRAKEAVDVLAAASGGSSIYRDVPIQRISRDVQAVTLHALMHPSTNAELHGRDLCGLEPNTQYL